MKKKSVIILLIVAVLSIVAAVAFEYVTDRKSSPQYPEIKFASQSIDVYVGATEAELLKGVTATDPEDGDVTDSVVIEGISRIVEGTNMKVTYAAFDSQNHVTKAERTVNYIDYVKPHFTMSGPMVFKNARDVSFISLVGAVDIFEGDISGRVKYSLANSASIDGADEYEVKLSVTNKIGDTVTLPITVSILDDYSNSAMITLSDYLVYVQTGSAFDPASYVESYTVRGNEVDSAKGLKITNNVNTNEPGIYTVDYTESKTKSMTRLLVVVE